MGTTDIRGGLTGMIRSEYWERPNAQSTRLALGWRDRGREEGTAGGPETATTRTTGVGSIAGPAHGPAPPVEIGASVLVLLGDEVVPRILRLLDEGPTTTSMLTQRLADVASSTFAKRLRDALDAGVLSRHPSPRADQTGVYRLTDLGHDLHALFDAAHEWVMAGPGAVVDEPSRLSLTATILGALADGDGRAVLHAVDEGASGPAPLEQELTHLTRGVIQTTLRRYETLRLVGRETSSTSRSGPVRVTIWAREAVAFVAWAARLEERHAVLGAVVATPGDGARLLRFAVPLLAPSSGEGGACRIAIEPEPGRPATPATFLIQSGPESVVATDATPEATVSAQARGTITGWWAAILDGDRTQLALAGDVVLAEGLVAELHERLMRRPGGDQEGQRP